MKHVNYSKLFSFLIVLFGLQLSAGAQVTTFNFNGTVGLGGAGLSGTPQTYVVPPGVTALGIDMKGAKGGWPCCSWPSSGSAGPVAPGGRVQCTLNVTPGETLYVYVGGAGADNYNSGTQCPGGWNGGGIGGAPSSAFCAAGGGATDIRTSTAAAYSTSVLVVAGAGGGGGDFGPVGGSGGGLTGGAGAGGSACGGGQTGPACATGVGLGTQGQGGSCVCYSAGGGGGGWWGGNGGVVNNGAGGGGSSYTHPTRCSGVVHTQGFSGAVGHGQVIITELCVNPAAITGAAPGAICVGGGMTLADATAGGAWSSSNAAIASVTGGTVTATGTGTATISYTVPGGCFAATTVTVNAAPSITSISNNAPLCANGNLTLTANTPLNVAAYDWTGPGAITGATTASASVPGITTSGSGTYTLTISNGTGSGCAMSYTSVVSILASPSSISGTASVCVGSTTTLTNSVSGGTWSSSNSAIATVGASGIVSGISAGTSTISYTLSSGCAAGKVVTVNALPIMVISPSTSSTICLNSSSSFTASAPGSTYDWAGISGATGLSCSTCASPVITPGTTGANVYSVTATTAAGCTTTSGVTINVNALPSDITGSSNVCIGTSTTLSAGTGGTWGSSSAGVASIGITSGIVSGVAAGGVTISYVLPNGCYKTLGMTVLSTPASIAGTGVVCSGLTTNLTHPVSGGIWSSSSTTVASVNPSGVVTGNSAGNATISYTLPSGCIVNLVATVNALPSAISGPGAVCVGSTVTLTDADAGGTWSSSSSNASVNMFSGVVTGVTAGNAVLSYIMPNACYRTVNMVVNPLPAAITGTTSTCHNSIAFLSDATPGGTYSSSNTGIAFVDASGIVTGITPGTVTISYTLGTGCRQTTSFVVNPLPSTIGGTLTVCQGSTTTLTNADAGGTWASSNTGVATINSAGVATGVSAGATTITYTLATGCRKTASLSVNPLPVPITGTPVVCVDATTTLFNFSFGGTWTSGSPAIAGISAAGEVTGVSAGLVNISYELPTGCMRSQIVTVNALPAAISGSGAVCVNQSTTLSDASAGGTWSSSSPGAATIDGSGVVMGVASGNTVITYTLPTGCSSTLLLTVNGLPANISGGAAVCKGLTTTFGNATSGGAWTSENTSIATVSGSGVVTGVDAGNAAITYTLPTGCYRTRNILVNPLPAAIGGNTQVCVGATTTLDNTTGGGAWSSSATGTAPVTAAGVVSGLAAGGGNITYTLPTGCQSNVAVVVNPLPGSITGALNVCMGSTTTLNNISAGGSWDVANTSVATITSSGVVTGVNTGNTLVSYTLPTGCMRTANVVVNPLPTPIAGVLNVCQGMTTALSDINPGGAWSSSAIGTASVSSAGVVTGVAVGTANITYTLPTSCRTASTVVVNALPAAITGTLRVCAGSTTMISNGTINGSWSSSTPSVATVDATGMVSGVAEGTTTISYTLLTGCYKTAVVSVDPLPAAITGASSVCQAMNVALSNATGGGTWSSSNPSTAVVSAGGVVTGIAPGVVAISYTLPTGCARTMAISIESLPSPITGPGTVCVGGTSMLGSLTAGGFWGSASAVAEVSFLGEVSGLAAGTATITYMMPSGCIRTRVITVNSLPSVIAGANNVCSGSMTTLSNGSTGGTWISNSDAHATVNSLSGEVTGVSAGVVLISYVLPTGCQRVQSMTVNTTPAAIAGTTTICNNGTSLLTTTTTGGVWISGNTSVAIVGLAGGNVTGLSAGVTAISYTMPTGCMTMTMMTVNANPAAISGITSVCEGSGTVLSNATPGGIWNVSDASIATIGGSGVLSGVMPGNATVTYSLGTGCNTTASIAVNAVPSIQTVTGGGSYCAGGAGVTVGLGGSSPLTTYKLYRSGTGIPVGTYSGTGTPLYFGTIGTAGLYTVTATNAMGCTSAMSGSAAVSITPVVTPAVGVMSGAGDTVCAGTTVTFSAAATNGGTAPTYEWRVNSTLMSGSGGSFVHTPINGDVVSVTLSSNAACATPAMVSGSKMMNVMSIETPSIGISVSPSASICNGTTAMFTATAANGGAAPSYNWTKNGTISMGTGATLSYKPVDGDKIVCWLNSNYRCTSVNNVPSNMITMNVDQVYVPEVQITVTPGTTVHTGEQVTFNTTVTNAGPAPVYQWLKNGILIGGANTGTYIGSNFTNGDSVTCVVIGSGVCGKPTINSVRLTVLPSTGVAATTTGNMEVRLVPNPNNGTFTVSGSVGTTTATEVMLEVTDMLGQVVYHNTVKAANGQLETSIQLGNTLANGMYLLNLTTGADHKAFHFVVKQ